MLTPAFELDQDERFLYIKIKAPFAKIADTEIFMADCEFKFYSKPYYLRLNLPGPVVEDGQEKAKYEVDKGEFDIKVTKVNKGEYFEGLEMLTKLLAPAGQSTAKTPTIEVLESSSGACADVADEEEEDDFDWQIEQQPFVEEGINLGGPKYGFANERSGVLKRLKEELLGVIDLEDADSTPISDRRKLRIDAEQAKFDDEYYLADLYDDELIMNLIMYKPPWADEYTATKEGEPSTIEFTDEEKEVMRKLPRKEYLLDDRTQQLALLSLVDILFAYAYNHRTTEGESNVESAWTVSKLSATLSWFEQYSSIKDVCIACYRRSLTYPLYRHWKLSTKVWKDTHRILAVGKKRILKCLLEIHNMLINTDGHYILNDLYISDYCVWIQSVSERKIQSLARSVEKITLEKSDIDLELNLLEQAGALAAQENKAAQQLSQQVSDLSLNSPCPRHSPRKSTSSSQSTSANGRIVDLNDSFPKADLDLASSTDSCSDSDSESETDSEVSDDDSDDTENEAVSDNTLEKASELTDSEKIGDSSLDQSTEEGAKLSVAKEDSTTLNF